MLAEQSRREWIGAAPYARGARRRRSNSCRPAPGVPDLVFTANAAVVLDRKALLARFRYPQRRAEESHYKAAFAVAAGARPDRHVRTLPDDIVLEGAGDCVFDETRNLFWMGYGPRSDTAAREVVEKTFGVEVVALELVDPRFYHMDTALCGLAERRDHVCARTPSPRRAGRRSPAGRAGQQRIETRRGGCRASSPPTQSVSAIPW